MLRVGLTGGIASGKSTVAWILRDSDCQVLEMDPLGHEMLEPGQPAYDEVVAEFGKEILEPSGKVDRSKLGAIVFADPAKRARLNQILHPRILEVVRELVRGARSARRSGTCVCGSGVDRGIGFSQGARPAGSLLVPLPSSKLNACRSAAFAGTSTAADRRANAYRRKAATMPTS